MPGRNPPIEDRLRNYLSLFRALATPIDTKGVQGKTLSLSEALGVIMEKAAEENVELPIIVDKGAFARAHPGIDIREVVVRIPSSRGKRPAGTVLKQILDQLPKKDAICLIRFCYIEITQQRQVGLREWVRQFCTPKHALLGSKQKRVE
jgi:hypothetical protein